MRDLSDDEVDAMLVATRLYAEHAETYRREINESSE
jgi:hypothetical protein